MAALEMFPNTVGESRILDIHFAKQLIMQISQDSVLL